VILDQLSECEPYRKLSERFAAGFDYLRSNVFETMADEKYAIDGEDLFAMVQSYQTKPRDQGRWEAHRHYADIQYVVSGTEVMGVAALSGMTVEQAYSREKDVEFFFGAGQFIRVDRGCFTIFLPQDVHMPQLQIDAPAAVKKVVVKVRLS
jgi:YhcH/YjgK/YiaL family protein